MKTFRHFLEDTRNKVGELVPINQILQGPIKQNLDQREKVQKFITRYRKTDTY